MGMLLFIVSEVMFSLHSLGIFLHSQFQCKCSLVGGVWPPRLHDHFRSLEGTSLTITTVILLSSGATVTWAHHARVWGSKSNACLALVYTLVFASGFTALQALFEYITSPFSLF